MSLPGEAWLDEDGRHVWFRHDCIIDDKRQSIDWMLPWPNWKEADRYVQPSIQCTVPGCGFHSSPMIRKPPTNWTPRRTK